LAYLVEENRVLRKQLQIGVPGSARQNGIGSPFVGTGQADACCARSRRSSRLTRFSDASTVDRSDGVLRTNRDCDQVQNQSRRVTSRTRCARDDARGRRSLV